MKTDRRSSAHEMKLEEVGTGMGSVVEPGDAVLAPRTPFRRFDVSCGNLGLKVVALLLYLIVPQLASGQPTPETGEEGVLLELELANTREVRLLQAADGSYVYKILHVDGASRVLAPDALSELLYRERTERPWWGLLLNVSSWTGIAWVALGFLGQLMFAGRMLVQWWASEKRKRSFVPVAFWWLSLAASSTILIYFLWRRDPVGILGQLAGWTIYTRNLWFIYRGLGPESVRDGVGA